MTDQFENSKDQFENSRQVVTLEEQQIIIDWVLENWKTFIFNKNNNGYYVSPHMIEEAYKNNTVYECIQNIEKRIIKKENLQTFQKPTALEDFIYYMDSGTKLHPHKDPNDENGYQVRFNVCIQKPDAGGLPIYAGKKLNIFEREYIICRAGLDTHTSGVIYGNKPKINISYGFSVDKDSLHLYTNRETPIR